MAFGKGPPQLEELHFAEINSLLRRDGSLWQRDYFDRLVRDEKHFASCVRYVRRNPAKAHLHSGEYILYETELARSIE